MQQTISFKKLLLTSLCATVLAACGSSGGSSSSPDLSGNTNNSGSTAATGLTAQQLAQKQQAAAATLGIAIDLNQTDNGQNSRVTKLEVTVNGKKYNGQAYPGSNTFATPLNINDFAQGFTDQSFAATANGTNNQSAKVEGTLKIYNQPYSFTSGIYETKSTENGKTLTSDHREATYGGIHTASLPANSTYNYKGTAFSKTDKGVLDYTITFGTNNTGSGKGKIIGLSSYGDIDLAQASIRSGVRFESLSTGNQVTTNGFSISGQANYTGGSGDYELGIFGPQATEIAGKIDTDKQYIDPSDGEEFDDVISFAGSKQ